MKPIFLSLGVFSSVLSVGLCLSTPFQLPFLGLPSAEQKIEVLSEHLHFPTGEARNAQQNRWENFPKAQNSANWSRERRCSQVSWQQPLHSSRQDSPKEALWARMSCWNILHFSAPWKMALTWAAHLNEVPLCWILIHAPSCVFFSTSWHSFAVCFFFLTLQNRFVSWLQRGETVLWASPEEAALTRGKTDRSVINLLMQHAGKWNIESWMWVFPQCRVNMCAGMRGCAALSSNKDCIHPWCKGGRGRGLYFSEGIACPGKM